MTVREIMIKFVIGLERDCGAVGKAPKPDIPHQAQIRHTSVIEVAIYLI